MEPFIGEIRVVAFNYAPYGWAFCNGQIMPIAQNQALFAVIGTRYGGDGKTTFALPDLRGKAPVEAGLGSGLSQRDLGKSGGSRTVALAPEQMPAHAHAARAYDGSGDQLDPRSTEWATAQVSRVGIALYKPPPATTVAMNAQALGTVGGGAAHNNMQPYLTLNYIIAVQGIFPVKG